MNASRPERSARRSSRPWILLAAAPVVVIAALWLVTRGPDTEARTGPPVLSVPPPAPAPMVSIASDRAVHLLRGEVDELRRRLTELVSGAPGAGSAEGASPDVAPRETDEIRDEAMAMAKARRALFADTLANDPDDPTWSGVASQRIQSSFVEHLPSDVVLEDVSCRSTLCRISVRYASAQASEIGAEHLPHLVPWNTRGIMYADDRDPARIVFYAARTPELAPQ